MNQNPNCDSDLLNPVERYTESDGTLWVRVWMNIRPGMSQLVWVRIRKATVMTTELTVANTIGQQIGPT